MKLVICERHRTPLLISNICLGLELSGNKSLSEPMLIQITVNTLKPRQNGRHYPDDTFKCIYVNENVRISIKISLKFVPKGPINNNPALVQIMAWRRPGDKPLSQPMMVGLPTHFCVTQPQWVNRLMLTFQLWEPLEFIDGLIARLWWYLQSISSGDTAVLHKIINIRD